MDIFVSFLTFSPVFIAMTFLNLIAPSAYPNLRTLLAAFAWFAGSLVLSSDADADPSLSRRLNTYTQHPFFTESAVGVQVVNLKTMENGTEGKWN